MNSGNTVCPIILACDEAYAMPLATTLRSIVESNQRNWPLDFHVLSEGFSEHSQGKVLDSLPKGSATIRWIPIDLGAFSKLPTLGYISKMTFARFLIPSIVPANTSKVLYLDTDILVLDDLMPLCNTDLDGAILGAVLDGLDMHIKQGTPGYEDVLAKVPRVKEYFNAGILLIDVEKWIKEEISERALDYLIQHPYTPYADQDAINVGCDGLWKKLDPWWNYQEHLSGKIVALDASMRPGIVHFVTSLKPWKPSSLSLNADFYDSFRSRTCFARNPFDKFLDFMDSSCSQVKNALKQVGFFQSLLHRQ